MKRRSFTARLGWSVAAGLLLPQCKAEAQTQDKAIQNKEGVPGRELIKPKSLKAGQTIGLITPGSYIPDQDLEKAEQNLERLGLNIKRGKHLRALNGFTAGTDEQRLEDLHAMFADPEVDAIWCARGGYGCTRLLPNIDFELIRNNPKILIGYSDITALTTAIFQETGLVCFHGPVAASTFTDYTQEELKAILFSTASSKTIRISEKNAAKNSPLFKTQVLQSGKPKGTLIGGNLSLLAAMAGTPWALQPADKLVFMEEIQEKPYRVDRMLTQLVQASPMDKAAGFALGIFSGCVPDPEDRSLTLAQTLERQFTKLARPAIYGLSFGHISDQCTLPVGIQATLNTEDQTITLNESWLTD